MAEVLTNHRHLFIDARNEASAQGRPAIILPVRSNTPGSDEAQDAPTKLNRKQKQVMKNQEKAAAQAKSPAKKGKGKGGALLALPAPPQVLAIADAASPKAPSKMFSKLKALMAANKSKVCRWWNLPGDCNHGSACTFDHKCAECGEDHKWFEKHF